MIRGVWDSLRKNWVVTDCKHFTVESLEKCIMHNGAAHGNMESLGGTKMKKKNLSCLLNLLRPTGEIRALRAKIVMVVGGGRMSKIAIRKCCAFAIKREEDRGAAPS